MKSSKLILTIVALVCTVSIGVAFTVAYFASLSGPVRNTFTVGHVKIALTETSGDEYQLIPGTTIHKDPLITVGKESEECWVYVKLERTNNLDSYVTYALEDGWTHLGGFDGVYYRLVEKSAVDKTYKVLKNDQMTVKNNITKEKMAEINNSAYPQMKITAYATQTLGIENVADGWYNLMTEYGSN